LAGGVQIITNYGFSGSSLVPSLAIIASMTAGTMFAIWLGELISEYGIRNQGLSLLIFAGIVSRIPQNFGSIMRTQENQLLTLAIVLVITILIIFAIVYVQQGQRNIPVMYPGRRVGNRQSMPVKGALPLKVNMAGMIPLIFGQSLLTFPAIVASFFVNSETAWVANFANSTQQLFGGQSPWYWLLYFLMVIGFTFFYTDVLFTQQDYGSNLKRAGAQIPGVSRGAPTQRYLTKVLRRITFPGAFFLGTIAVLPFVLGVLLTAMGLSGFGASGTGTMLVTSSGLLIVVGVVRDTFQNIDAELKLHGYDEKLLVR
jgi:preprotein translocase subunit SecY